MKIDIKGIGKKRRLVVPKGWYAVPHHEFVREGDYWANTISKVWLKQQGWTNAGVAALILGGGGNGGLVIRKIKDKNNIYNDDPPNPPEPLTHIHIGGYEVDFTPYGVQVGCTFVSNEIIRQIAIKKGFIKPT